MNLLSIAQPLLPLVLGVFGLLVLVSMVGVILALVSRKNGTEEEVGKSLYKYGRKKCFMTRSESAFYKLLQEAVGRKYFVFPQAHLPTIVDGKITGQNWKAARAHIDRKSVDFVLCDKEHISPVLAIELDDISHERPDRVERDQEVERILKQAGLPLLRVANVNELSVEQLRERIKTVSLGSNAIG